MKNWAMLACNYDEVTDIGWPCMGQPKLNGVRAIWCEDKFLFSRQGKLFNSNAIPHIYEKLLAFSARYPGVVLDGELYCHGMLLQEIIRRVAIHRNEPHPDAGAIDFHAFDIINDALTEERQLTLVQIYEPWVPVCKVMNAAEVETWLNCFIATGHEGLMLRQYHCNYHAGRTERLIKVKPWKYFKAVIVGFNEGKGKYKDTLGALRLEIRCKGLKSRRFCASGGLSDKEREFIWRHQPLYTEKVIPLRCRDYANSGIPLMPQVVSV